MSLPSATLAEQMAIAVLKGDLVAARALADLLCETYSVADREVLPVKTITCDKRKLRAVFSTYPSLGGDVEVDGRSLLEGYHRWLEYGEPLRLMGVHMDLYELPYEAKEPPLVEYAAAPRLLTEDDVRRITQGQDRYMNGVERYITLSGMRPPINMAELQWGRPTEPDEIVE